MVVSGYLSSICSTHPICHQPCGVSWHSLGCQDRHAADVSFKESRQWQLDYTLHRSALWRSKYIKERVRMIIRTKCLICIINWLTWSDSNSCFMKVPALMKVHLHSIVNESYLKQLCYRKFTAFLFNLIWLFTCSQYVSYTFISIQNIQPECSFPTKDIVVLNFILFLLYFQFVLLV